MLYKSIINKNDLVFDIGANIGNRTKMFLELGAKVVCVEPQVECIEIIKRRFGEKISIVQKVLGEEENNVDFYVASTNTVSTYSKKFIKETKENGRFKNIKWDKKISVEMTNLDSIIKEYGIPKFCKIDTEGSEINVLRGLSIPIEYISFEFTPEIGKDSLMCIDRLLEIDSNYQFNYSEGESLEFISDKWVQKVDMKNFLSPMIFNKPMVFGDIYSRLGQ